MKFISGIRTFESINGRMEVGLQHFHRAAVGLLSGTTVYVYPRKTEHELPKSNRKIDNREVILSLFSPQNWTHIWKLEISAIDRPGLTRKITKVLKDMEVNIFIQESLIANYEQDFTVSIIADFGKYFEKSVPKDKKVKDILPADHWEGIKKRFSVESPEEDFGITIQKFEPIKFLTNISEDEIVDGNSLSTRKTQIKYNELIGFYRSPTQAAVKKIGPDLKKTGIELERHLLTALNLSDWIDIDDDTIQGTIFSDTEEKYIIVRFFDPDLMVAHLEIVHGNHVGAIHAFTEAIHETHPEYNIISSYNRIENERRTARWHVLIDVTSEPKSLSGLIKKINDIATIPGIEVRPINYSKKLATTKNLPLSVMQKKEQKSSIGSATTATKAVDQKDEEIQLLKDLINLEKLLQAKKESLGTITTLGSNLDFYIERHVNLFKLFLCLLILICVAIPVILIRLYTWDVMEPWIWGFSIIPFVLTYLSASIRSASFNPLKFILNFRRNYRERIHRRNNFKEEDIAQLVEAVTKIQSEIDGIKAKIKQPNK